MKTKISATYLFNQPTIITASDDFVDELILTGSTMKSMAEKFMTVYKCSYEDAMNFIQDLPNKLIYDNNKPHITLQMSNI